MSGKVRITVDLDTSEYEELSILKERFDRPLAWLGRRAVCEFLEKHRQKDVTDFDPLATPNYEIKGYDQ